MVHCETTTGILNPIEAVGHVTRKAGRTFIVDAMSSFGGMPIDFERCGIDFLITSANKCLREFQAFPSSWQDAPVGSPTLRCLDA